MLVEYSTDRRVACSYGFHLVWQAGSSLWLGESMGVLSVLLESSGNIFLEA